jgi:hypothetical protein
MPGKKKQSKKGGRAKNGKGSLVDRLKSIRLGDLGEAIGGAWEGIGRLTGWNEEIKRFDTSATAQAATNAGALFNLTQMAQGVDYNQRDGLSVRLLGMETDITFISSATQNASVRLIALLDLDNQGATPAVADVVEGALLATTNAVNAKFEHTNTERFVILYDEHLPITLAPSAASIQTRKLRIPLGTHCRYSAAAGAVASGREGQVFLMFIGSTAANHSTFDFSNRVAYVDN